MGWLKASFRNFFLPSKFNYTGGRVPRNATHITVDESVTVIPEYAFANNRNIVEVVCDVNVKKVEEGAFFNCRSLRRVIMPGVEIVENSAFNNCKALKDVECGNLEIIKDYAFSRCESLRSIDLSSAKIVEGHVFYCCEALERITIPLKDGIITHDNIFAGCENLKHVDLVEGELHETIAALQLEEWRNDMNEEIDSINQILPTACAGGWGRDDGEKARAIRRWIRSVLCKIIHYKAEHQRYLNEELAPTLQLALPRDIVMNNVLPFLELPSYTFEVLGDHEEE